MITGVDQPRLGTGVFQRTFSVSLQCRGRPRFFSPGASTCPSPIGPRNSGQSARAPAVASDRQQIVEKILCFIETWLHNLKHLTRTGSPPFAPGEVSEPAGPGR